jgi:hypothetical protein
MSKTRTVFTPEQKSEYWKKRIYDKQRSALTQFVKTFKEATDMALHIGVDQKKINEIAEQFDGAMAKFTNLVHDQKIKE